MFYLLPSLYVLLILYFTIKGYDPKKSDSSYFFSSFQTNWKSSLISVFATETSVATILVFPAVGYSYNFNIIFLCFGYIIGRWIVAYWYLKHYHKIEGISLYEHISLPESKYIMSFAYLLAKYISGSVRFYLAGYGLSQITGFSIEFWLLGMIFLIAMYSITGGLKSVILTDQIQGGIIIIFGFFFFVFLVFQNPSYTKEIYSKIHWNPEISLYLFIGSILLTISSHGGDQDILQRIFSVNQLNKAKIALILSGLISSFVILCFVAIGLLLTQYSSLNVKSPLLDWIQKINPISLPSFYIETFRSLFLVLLIASAMSTLDSAVHATGAIWKSIIPIDRIPNYLYSSFSLLIMALLSFLFIQISKNQDFLSLSLGFMNYVNGTLFSVITLFVMYKKKLKSFVILGILITNIVSTLICNYFQLYWAFTTIISFLLALLVGIIIFRIYENQ